MIYTVTCNPALDCAVRLDSLTPGVINFTRDSTLTPGGKGVNVSRVLTALGEPTTALGFVAGSNGRLLESALKGMGLATDFVHLERGQTRINVKLYGDTETQLNAPGAPVLPAAMDTLLERLGDLSADAVCLCGSPAPGMETDAYARMLAAVKCPYTVVDTTGAALLAALGERPWLIKPNREELATLAGHDLPTLAEVIAAAESLMDKGAQNVLVSLGGEGALWCGGDGVRLYQPAPDGRVIGTVGAGDSTVAGFVAGWLRYGDARRALRLGVACGSATAFAEGLADAEGIAAVLDRLPEIVEM